MSTETQNEIEQSVHFAEAGRLRQMIADCLAERETDLGDPWAAPMPKDLRFSNVDHDPDGRVTMTTGLVHADGVPTYRFEVAYGTQSEPVAVYDELEIVFEDSAEYY